MTIVDHARAQLDTPFRHQGREPGKGLDCAGLVVISYAAAGYLLNDVQGYGRTPHAGMLLRTILDQPLLEYVPPRKAAPGDILLLRFDGEPTHLAIRTPRGMIHSYQKAGRVVEHGLSAGWGSRIVRAFTLRSSCK